MIRSAIEKWINVTSLRLFKVCKNQEFFQLSAEQLASLLKSDDLNVTSEEEVFYSLMEWVQHDQTNREKDVPDLLSLIRLPLLAPVFIADHVETLCSSTECQRKCCSDWIIGWRIDNIFWPFLNLPEISENVPMIFTYTKSQSKFSNFGQWISRSDPSVSTFDKIRNFLLIFCTFSFVNFLF